MSQERASQPRIIGVHLATGLVVAGLAGVVYFAADVLWVFRGRYRLLDASLAEILAVYAASALAGGLVVALLVGLFGSLVRRLTRPLQITAFYVSMAGFFIFSAMFLREYTIARLKTFFRSFDFVVVIAAFVVFATLGYVLARAFSRRRALEMPRTRRLVSVAAMTLGAAALVILNGGAAHRSVPGPRTGANLGPNVVLIVLDALRADHMSCYGYPKSTTPNMDRLAAEGVLFSKARSHGNRTILSMPAVFTSLYPSYHGALGFRELMRPLPVDRTTLAEMLQGAGYTTVGLMTNVYLKTVFGMTQGFDRVEEFNGGKYSLSLYKGLRLLRILKRPAFLDKGRPDAAELTDHALRWLEALGDRPFFLYVHYMDTHHAYDPPPPFDTMFADSANGYDAKALFDKTVRVLKDPPPRRLGEGELRRLKAYYDGAIRYTDHEIGRLLSAVRELSRHRETLVIITSDHGDEFFEHGSVYHTNLLIEQLIHVPLIVWQPNRISGGLEVTSLVRHIDILPTVADLVGVEPPAGVMGASLLPLIDGDEVDLHLTSFAEGDFCASLSFENWKLTYVDSTNTAYLYDISEDPGETVDLSELEPDVFKLLKSELDSYLDRAREVRQRTEKPVDPETLRQLKALGYL